MADERFDVLQALSLARTALDDPEQLDVSAVAVLYGGDREAVLTGYAIDRLDEAIGALHFEPANDSASGARWVLTNLGRLLADACDRIDHEAAVWVDVDDREKWWKAVAALTEAGERIDEAIAELTAGVAEDDRCST